MAVEVFMPKAGMDMKEGKIIKWLKNVGDTVQEGDGLLEIETDKVSMEVEAPASGTLLCRYFEDGNTVPVVTIIGYVGKEGETVPDAPTQAGGEVKAADNAAIGSTVQTAETGIQKTAVPKTEGYVPASAYAKFLAKEKGVSLHEIAPSGSLGEVKARDVLEAAEHGKILATPLAQRIAAEKGIDLSTVNGTGYNGKVTKSDLVTEEAPKTVQQSSAPAKGQRREKLSGMRKVVADRMLKSHTEMPCVTHNMKADVTELMELREKINAKREKADKISVNDFVLKAVACALEKNTNILVSIEGDEVVYKEEVNIGMAVAVDNGLIVPVLKNVDSMSLGQVSRTAKDLAKRARDNKLAMDEYKGSTFTITNLGMYEVESFNPIINQPDSGILGVCTVTEEVKCIKGEFTVRKMMGLSFTHDHRVIDGAPAASFLRDVKHILQDPMSIVVD